MTIRDKSIEPFYIDVEEDQFTLREDCTVQEGENKGNTYMQTRGYFTSFEGCVMKIVRIKLARHEEIFSLEEFLNLYKIEVEFIKQLFAEKAQSL